MPIYNKKARLAAEKEAEKTAPKPKTPPVEATKPVKTASKGATKKVQKTTKKKSNTNKTFILYCFFFARANFNKPMNGFMKKQMKQFISSFSDLDFGF